MPHADGRARHILAPIHCNSAGLRHCHPNNGEMRACGKVIESRSYSPSSDEPREGADEGTPQRVLDKNSFKSISYVRKLDAP